MYRQFNPDKETPDYETRVSRGQVTCNARLSRERVLETGNKRTKRCANTAEFVDKRKVAAYCWEHRERATR